VEVFKPLEEASMANVSTVGLDLAKNVFQVHGADSAGAVLVRRKLRRGQVLSFFAALPPCTVAMEACAGAHYWGREITRLGHQVRLIAPVYVKPFVKRQKNDAADAAAICEAAQRPTMRFVAVKSEETQAAAVVFRTRDLLVRQRTQTINALRGHLAEFGVIAARGLFHVSRLVAVVGPWLRPAADCSSHVGGKPGLVDEDETVRIEIRLTIEPVPPPLQDVRPILLARMGGLFLNVSPQRSRNVHSVARLARTSRSAARRSSSSLIVRSGVCATRSSR
jgi:hypothetical protein